MSLAHRHKSINTAAAARAAARRVRRSVRPLPHAFHPRPGAPSQLRSPASALRASGPGNNFPKNRKRKDGGVLTHSPIPARGARRAREGHPSAELPGPRDQVTTPQTHPLPTRAASHGTGGSKQAPAPSPRGRPTRPTQPQAGAGAGRPEERRRGTRVSAPPEPAPRARRSQLYRRRRAHARRTTRSPAAPSRRRRPQPGRAAGPERRRPPWPWRAEPLGTRSTGHKFVRGSRGPGRRGRSRPEGCGGGGEREAPRGARVGKVRKEATAAPPATRKVAAASRRPPAPCPAPCALAGMRRRGG